MLIRGHLTGHFCRSQMRVLFATLALQCCVWARGRVQSGVLPAVRAVPGQAQRVPAQQEPSPADDKKGEKPIRDDDKKIETLTAPLPVPADLGQAPQPIDLPTALRLEDDQNPE